MRDAEPLLLSRLCDRGAFVQPTSQVITRTRTGYHTQSYVEHLRRSRKLASALSKWGVQVEDRVATLMWNTGWHFECYHAVSCMGACLHTLNLRLSAADLSYIISHAQDRLIFVDAILLDLLSKVDASSLASIELFVCIGEDAEPGRWAQTTDPSKTLDYEDFLASGSEDFEWPVVPDSCTMGLCYTSGTTGRPKGASYSQRSTYLHTLMIVGVDQLAISGAEVVMPFVPMFHVLSWGIPFALLMTGATAVFTSNFTDPGSMLQTMVDWKVQVSSGVPTVWQGLRAQIQQQGLEPLKPKIWLRRLICGGSAPPAEMMRWYLDELGVEFVQVWGMTETNPLGSIARRVSKIKDLEKSVEESFTNVTKAGLPCPGLQFRIAQSDDLSKDVARGAAGELLVKGPWIIHEYYQVKAPDKFFQGWLITGDVAKIDEEGAIIISDRSKDVIKSGGEWISSIDMENAVAAMPGIAMAAVVGVPHPRWDERPVAVVTLEPAAGDKELLERVHKHLAHTFAKFQLPDDVLVWNAIPLTSTGKIDKKVIRAMLEEQKYILPSLRGSKL
ncbi:unnamed protein product [Effrenium voratum]|uniref:Long-chain fatty acid--CoA ligase n=1 Tax=Effrenium voratum TaxID=2562239 RepID=A0AA36I7Q2_9DINO|nr:unnamed protein product [Effrenium voratum]CAJ1450229.1 unnamed protein product [Effrenium voratum]